MYLGYLPRDTIRRYLRCLSHCYWPLVAAAAALLLLLALLPRHGYAAALLLLPHQFVSASASQTYELKHGRYLLGRRRLPCFL